MLLAALLPLAACQSDEPRNLVLIVIDTLRADHLGAYGYERPTSPRIRAWAERGAVFERALANSPWTLPSMASLYTGAWPSRHAAGEMLARGSKERDNFVALDASIPTLAEILSDHDFATAAIVNNPFLDPALGMARGFSHYDLAAVDNVTVRRANLVVDRALAWLDERAPKPFFLLLHLFDPHMNYDPPVSVRGRFGDGYAGPLTLPIHRLDALRLGEIPLSEADRRFVAASYDEELLYVDGQVGRWLDEMQARGLSDETLTLILSDHGEEFWDHGGFEHGHTMYQELLRVPLIALGPGIRARRVEEPVSLADVLPTALAALGLPAPSEVAGHSLWPALTGGEAIPERSLVAERTLYGAEQKALIRWPYKLVVDWESQRSQLFDLAADPGEREDLADARGELRQSLLDELRQELDAAAARVRPKRPAQLDDATREGLRELGYLE